MHTVVYADLWRPARQSLSVLYDGAVALLGSVLIALAAQVALPLPWTPVPLTGQTFAVLLIGAALGRWRGSAAVALYLGEGAAGLPVFASGKAGWVWLLGPTGGYLWGFLLAAFLVGWLAERGWDRRLTTTAAAMGIGSLAIYACGLPWLARFVGWDAVVTAGLLPFVPGDLLKLVAATALLPTAWRLLGQRIQKGATR